VLSDSVLVVFFLATVALFDVLGGDAGCFLHHGLLTRKAKKVAQEKKTPFARMVGQGKRKNTNYLFFFLC